TRQASAERSEDVARAAPLMSEALRHVAHPPVRHRGTVVGSVVHADPAAELLTEVRVPARNGDAGHALVEFSRRHADFAVAGAAVAGGAIALFGVADTPVRATEAERVLAADGGASAGDVAAAATDGLTPNEDVHGGAAYRRRVARACVERALARA